MFSFPIHRGTYIQPGVYTFGGYSDIVSGTDSEDPYGFDSIVNFDGSSVSTNTVKLTDKMFGNTSNNIKSDIYIFGGYTKQVIDPDYMDTPLPCVGKIQKFNSVSCLAVSSTINARWNLNSSTLNGVIYLFKGITSPLAFPYSAHTWVGTEKFTGSAVVTVNGSISYAGGNPLEFNGVILDFDSGNSRIREYYGADAYGSVLASTAVEGKPGVIGSNVYLFGGYSTSSGGYVTTSKIKKWNGTALSQEAAVVNWDLSHQSVSTYKDKAYVAGGYAYRSFPNQENTILNYISSYDGTTWVGQAAYLPAASHSHSSTSISK
jgi:hypothetical protein